MFWCACDGLLLRVRRTACTQLAHNGFSKDTRKHISRHKSDAIDNYVEQDLSEMVRKTELLQGTTHANNKRKRENSWSLNGLGDRFACMFGF